MIQADKSGKLTRVCRPGTARVACAPLRSFPVRAVLALIALAICGPRAGAADVTKVPLFKPGMGGYPTFRMEALCVTPKGTILAFTEGRKGGSGVNGDVDLVMRRSFDGGKTWEPLQVAIDFGTSTVCYPCPLVDRDTGTIWLAMSQFSGGDQGTMARGESDASHVWISKSTDDGASWSEPVEITEHVKPAGTTWHAPGAGYGIQLRSGRLVFPCYHFRSGPEDKHRVHESSVFYSDDHGKTWKLGGIVNRYAAETEVEPETPIGKRVEARRGWMIPGRTDEAQVVELDDGRLLMNMRSYHCSYRRAISYSNDGGLTWSPVQLDDELVEPVCSGSIARHSSIRNGDKRSRIVFANTCQLPERQAYNGYGMSRENLTLRVSYDEGESWPISRVLDPGPTGNLNMLTLPDGRIAVLYESGPQIFRETIYFATCTLDWLTEGKEPEQTAADHSRQSNGQGLAHFERRIRPLLLKHCVNCHGPSRSESGLRLDSREGLSRGGESGPVISRRRPRESRLLGAVHYASDLKMPPDGRLTDAEIADLEHWVLNGATWGGDTKIERKTASAHWAFQSIRHPPLPETADRTWPRTPIDRFLLADWEAEGRQPAARADRRTLIRRVTYDLTGLPPTPVEIRSFLEDDSPHAFGKVVERLLSSPAYGEHWARHWLDVARYADSNGLDENMAYGSAYHYRDFVIAAFNRDMPFDEFVTVQIAGDLMSPPGRPENVGDLQWEARLIQEASDRTRATGFLALGPKGLREVDGTKMELDIIDDQIATVSKAFMGLTLECSRCHDHKFDPISTDDYYALAGIFKSTRTMSRINDKRGKGNGFWLEQAIALDADAMARFRRAEAVFRADIGALEEEIGETVVGILRIEPTKRSETQQQALTSYSSASAANAESIRRWQALRMNAPVKPATATVMSVREGEPQDVPVHKRGSHLDLGETVPRRFPEFLTGNNPQLGIGPQESGRLQLARWLTDPRHPLTSRVIVNRVWQWHFGVGLVATCDNFGSQGEPPSHPDMLDWLAGEFMANGWSIKWLHRVILNSSAWQMRLAAQAESDSTGLGSIVNRRRLSAEEIRDAMLHVSGSLDSTMGGSLLQLKSRQYVSDAKTGRHLVTYENTRRSVYQPVIRNRVYEMFRLFDFPNPSMVNGRRASTTTPPQLLLMMNSELAGKCAGRLADRLLAEQAGEISRIRSACEILYGRLPDQSEIELATEFLTQYRASLEPQNRTPAVVWQGLCQALLIANEFIYVD